ncbi:MAG: Ku protein [Hyphomicrobiales bacterium]|nr:Ku protein [Hyphomicrobiales bacterium]MBV9590996.1 Ku protein [Hyphomicrobiales bacterium]MBV9973807.1 Ku protein [Hyphomicrobiales bacterium]
MAPRANWKGYLKLAELTCTVSLYTAVSTSERIVFHTLNRETGHRVRRQFIDEETGKPVESNDQVKGYETAKGEYVTLEPEEIASALPESDKTLAFEAFLECDAIDDLYFDRPYYLGPSDEVSEKAFAVIREGMREKKVAGLARTVLFRRLRTLLIRPYGTGMIATTLNFDYEIRSPQEAFADISDRKIKGEMLDLAKHIIDTKRGKFDPSQFEDRYETALAELVRAKLEGKPIEVRKPEPASNVVDLMEALRKSAGALAGSAGKTQSPPSKVRQRSEKPRKASRTPSGRSRSSPGAPHRRKAG